ncbi:hypothetical protein DAMA08_042770 [Martiniozyma asiatica (nom. inval.)]|nr:hypothetical protein DAMA08_027080 [Martiniozyma asiatica]GMM31532.1 hypothetical protein DAMA08_042770 [Martiniozyma asiatica]
MSKRSSEQFTTSPNKRIHSEFSPEVTNIHVDSELVPKEISTSPEAMVVEEPKENMQEDEYEYASGQDEIDKSDTDVNANANANANVDNAAAADDDDAKYDVVDVAVEQLHSDDSVPDISIIKKLQGRNEQKISNDANDLLNTIKESVELHVKGNMKPPIVTDLTTLQNQYKDIILDLEDKIYSLNEKLNFKNNEINDLTLRINNGKLTTNELVLKVDSLKSEINTKITELDLVNSSLTQSENERSKAQLLFEGEKGKLNQCIELCERLISQLASIEKENQELRNEKDNSKSVIELERRINELQTQLDDEKNKNEKHPKILEEELERLSNYLYVQYSQKHERKVNELKQIYKGKMKSKQQSYEKDIEILQEEALVNKKKLNSCQNKLEIVEKEKAKLIDLWDEFISVGGSKAELEELKNFLKKLK